MDPNQIVYQPVEGKTYTLFGESDTTSEYYTLIRSLSDQVLRGIKAETVLETLRKYSSHKRYLKRIVSGGNKGSLISTCLNSIHEELKPFTRQTKEHLKNLPISKIWDRRLATTEEQYHLYMLEIELTNRLNHQAFLAADLRISLQPYCLQDFSVDCKAKKSGFDYQCKHCSKACFQNEASRILSENRIEPYIWMGASLKSALKEAGQNNKSLAIMGIACIPELVAGMRKCMKYNIPVVGLPLNANRCVRWFGEFHQNSVDLNELSRLVDYTN
jgi:hypothetical protein